MIFQYKKQQEYTFLKLAHKDLEETCKMQNKLFSVIKNTKGQVMYSYSYQISHLYTIFLTLRALPVLRI